MAVAERSQIAQQSFGEFLGNVQRQWNQPKALKASFDAFTSRGPPAAEVAAATAVSSFQVSSVLSYRVIDGQAQQLPDQLSVVSQASICQKRNLASRRTLQFCTNSNVKIHGAGSLPGWLDGLFCQGASRCHGPDDTGRRKSRHVTARLACVCPVTSCLSQGYRTHTQTAIPKHAVLTLGLGCRSDCWPARASCLGAMLKAI